jgi:trehalose 6-phosphate phosphatase
LTRLLVASDYDGVLAPIVPDPALAYPQPAAVAALRELARLPGTTVALVSGRPRRELARLSGLAGAVRLVGGHGSELADEVELTGAQAALHRRLAGALRELVDRYPGVWLETKPTSLVVHTRPASAEVGHRAREAALAGPGRWAGVHPTTGKEVVELAVTDADKGTAVVALRERASADGVLFVGDDVTDENAFAVLDSERDVGVKVGPGATRAGYRVPDPETATRLLELLLRLRSRAADTAAG